jgi:hypothetical protein
MDGKDKQIVDEATMETASVVPPVPGEEDGAEGEVPEAERRPAGTVGD